jgi:hypothetical protein
MPDRYFRRIDEMIGAFFKYLVIGICAIVALKIVFGLAIGLLGIAIGALPFAILGYIVYKLVAPKKEKHLSDADRKWLES